MTTRTTTPKTPATTAGALGRTTAEQKLSQLCDADYRSVHPTVQALAMAITAGTPMPDPHRHRDSFQAVLDAARHHFAEQPTARTLRATARRLTAAVTQMADATAKQMEQRAKEDGE